MTANVDTLASLAISSASLAVVLVIGLLTLREMRESRRISAEMSTATRDAAEATRNAAASTRATLTFQKLDVLRRHHDRMLFRLGEMETLADHIYYDVSNGPDIRRLRGQLEAMVITFNVDVESSPYGLRVCRKELGNIEFGSIGDVHDLDAVRRGCRQARPEIREVLRSLAEELSNFYT